MKLNVKQSAVAVFTGVVATLAAVAALAVLSSSYAAAASSVDSPQAAALSDHGVFTGTKTITQTTVLSVAVGSPAEQAGLKVGDRILAVEGQNISSTKTLANVMSGKKPGDTLTLQVQGADGATRSVSVTLGDNPNKPGTAYLGISYGFLRGDKRGGFREGRGRGVLSTAPVIAAVQDGSPAAQAGLQPGDVINEVNGKTVDSFNALKDALAASKPGDKVTLKITRGSESQTVEVTLGENPNQKGAAYLGVSIGRGVLRRAPVRPPANSNTVTG